MRSNYIGYDQPASDQIIREALSREIAQQVDEFLAQGHTIKVIPMGETALKDLSITERQAERLRSIK